MRWPFASRMMAGRRDGGIPAACEVVAVALESRVLLHLDRSRACRRSSRDSAAKRVGCRTRGAAAAREQPLDGAPLASGQLGPLEFRAAADARARQAGAGESSDALDHDPIHA